MIIHSPRRPSALAVLSLIAAAACAAEPAAPDTDWPTYLGNKSRSLYSPLDQINRSNVASLRVAWTYDTGEKAEYQANNLVVDGILYTPTPSRRVIALDAATGREIWRWNPARERGAAGAPRQRGLVYWRNPEGTGDRLFTAVGNDLLALDPKSGRLITSFGDQGAIPLGAGLDTPNVPKIGLNTPGVLFRDILILGGLGGPGAVRGIDVRTGQRRWIFHLIPRPGEAGHETWPPEAYQTATGVMPWSGQALDEERGIVYVATKTAEPDFWGGDRHGQNLFANCLIALDAATGRRRWHFQIVHHDLLDKDLPCAPVLLTVTHQGRKIDAVAQGTKHGLLFVFDRVTGAPLWPIEERPVPASTLPGEQAWPTQPFPTRPAPLMRQAYTVDDASTISPQAQALTTDRIRLSPNAGPFPAPGLKESIMFPGFDGGMEWGGGAADPQGVYYVNVNEIPWILQMVATTRADGSPMPAGERDYLIHCAACHGADRSGNPPAGFPSLVDVEKRRPRAEIETLTKTGFGRMPAFDRLGDDQRRAILDHVLSGPSPAPAPTDQPRADAAPRIGSPGNPPFAFGGFRRWQDHEGYPAINPPWGTLNAVDLNTGELKWQVPLGEYKELTARGLAPTGTENYGGPVVTAGGLLFIAATADETIRAFHTETGAQLWQAPLPFSGNATPSTYSVGGRQFVVISAGGGKSGRPAGGILVAFALAAP